MRNKVMALTLMGAVAGFAFPLHSFAADDTVGEKAEEAAKDTGRAVKKGARKVKDKTCEMVNGKMDCAAKKLKHKAQNVGDKIEDATD